MLNGILTVLIPTAIYKEPKVMSIKKKVFKYYLCFKNSHFWQVRHRCIHALIAMIELIIIIIILLLIVMMIRHLDLHYLYKVLKIKIKTKSNLATPQEHKHSWCKRFYWPEPSSKPNSLVPSTCQLGWLFGITPSSRSFLFLFFCFLLISFFVLFFETAPQTFW